MLGKFRKGLFVLLAVILVTSLVSGSCSLRKTQTGPTNVTFTVAPAPEGASPYLPSIADVVEKVEPAVVSVHTQWTESGWFLQSVTQTAAGSGVIFDSDGYILTNNHVIENAEKIEVNIPESESFPKGATFKATLVGRDSLSDLAVLKIDAHNLPTATFLQPEDFGEMRVGDWVVAIGNALNLGLRSTEGIVSRLDVSMSVEGKTLHNLIETTAAINPGNSGGPLVNMAGEVIGINTAKVTSADNMGYAISTPTVVPVVKELMEKGRVVWPWIGISAQTLTPAIASEFNLSVDRGVLVRKIYQGHPADRAGLEENDVIIKLGEDEIANIEELQEATRKHQIGGTVKVTFVRGDEVKTAEVTLEEMPRQF